MEIFYHRKASNAALYTQTTSFKRTTLTFCMQYCNDLVFHFVIMGSRYSVSNKGQFVFWSAFPRVSAKGADCR